MVAQISEARRDEVPSAGTLNHAQRRPRATGRTRDPPADEQSDRAIDLLGTSVAGTGGARSDTRSRWRASVRRPPPALGAAPRTTGTGSGGGFRGGVAAGPALPRTARAGRGAPGTAL